MIEFQKIVPKDAEFIYRLMNNTQIMESLQETPSLLEDWQEAIGIWAEDLDEENYIIYDQSRPIGWIGINGLESTNKEAYIKMLAILPEVQGKGVGITSVQWVLDVLKSRDFTKVSLYTDKSNSIAQKCYGRCAFEVENIITDTMSNGNTVERYKMCRVL